MFMMFWLVFFKKVINGPQKSLILLMYRHTSEILQIQLQTTTKKVNIAKKQVTQIFVWVYKT